MELHFHCPPYICEVKREEFALSVLVGKDSLRHVVVFQYYILHITVWRDNTLLLSTALHVEEIKPRAGV